MVTGRQTAPLGNGPLGELGLTATRWLCAVAVLCGSACADIWGFDELHGSPDGGGSGGAGVLGSGGSEGGGGETGTGGSSTPTGSGGASGQGGASPSTGSGGAAGAGGRGGAGGAAGAAGRGNGGSPGTAAGGAGGRGGAVGAGGAAGRGVGGGAGTAGGGRGGAVGAGGATGAGPGGTAGSAACAPGTTHELLTNPAFESGETGWTVSVAGGFPIVYAADGSGGGTPAIAAQSPPNVAWLAGYNRADDLLTQRVVLPANASSLTLGFYYAIFTRETGTAENDVLDVQIITSTQTITLVHFSNNDTVEAWTHVSTSLPINLAGQTVTLQFHDTSNASLITSFYVDTVSLQAVTCP